MSSSLPIHQDASPEEVTPHTKRLVRLIISSPSSSDDSFCQSLTLLSNVASTSSPKVLWDLIYILYNSLTKNDVYADDIGPLKGGDKSVSVLVQKKNAALALEQIAAHLPTQNQITFLSEDHLTSNTDECGESLWLSVGDFLKLQGAADCTGSTHDKNDILTQVIDKGRLLLSSTGEEYDTNLYHLYRRENAAVAQTDASIDIDGNMKMSQQSVEHVILSRIRLQRQILAARLGLGNLPSSVLNLEPAISDQDLLGSSELPQYTQANAIQDKRNRTTKKRSLSKTKVTSSSKKSSGGIVTKKNKKIVDSVETLNDGEEEEALSSPLRYLLQRALTSTMDFSSPRSKCHPQNILATELLYQVFHPLWHVRFGALLGLLSLLRAWKRRCRFFSFGRWPNDILARCIAVLALDRFGDYSGSQFTHLDNQGESGCNYVHVDDIAPVREIAAEVVSLLLKWAPDDVQHSCVKVLSKLTRFQDHWEVRHGAMLVIRSIVQSCSCGGDIYDSCWKDLPQLAILGLTDSSDDVKGTSAQVLSSVITLLLQKRQEYRLNLEYLIACSSLSLWESFGTSNYVASSTYHLLCLLSEIIVEDSTLFLQSLESSTHSGSALMDMGIIFSRFADFMSHSLTSIRIACLKSIANFAVPIAALYQRRDVTERKNLLKSYTVVFKQLFEVILTHTNDESDYDVTEDTDEDSHNYTVPQDVFSENLQQTWNSITQSFVHFISPVDEKNESDIQSLFTHLLIDLIHRLLPSQQRGKQYHHERVTAVQSNTEDPYTFRKKVDSERFSNIYSGCEALAYVYLSPWCRPVDFYILGVACTILCGSPWLDYSDISFILLSVMSRNFISAGNGNNHAISNFLDICWSITEPLTRTTPLAIQLEATASDRVVFEERISNIFLQKLYDISLTIEDIMDVQNYSKIILEQLLTVSQLNTSTVDKNKISSDNTSIDEMRLMASLADAMIALAPRYTLPSKLTQVIRSLMTSIKNEKNENRHRVSCEALCNLIKQLTTTMHSSASVTKDKVIQTLCILATGKPSLDHTLTKEGQTSARFILRNIICDQLFSDDLERLRPLWNVIETVDCTDIETKRSDGVDLFHVISSSIRKGSMTFQHVLSTILPTLTSLASLSVFSHDSVTARIAVSNFCKIDPGTTIPVILPILLPYLSGAHQPVARTAGILLLKIIIDHLGVLLAPFVRILLPFTMSLMMDHVIDVAKTAAACFFCLVRIAPLAALNEPIPVTGLDHRGTQAERVIDHLILGKKLPSYELPDPVLDCTRHCNFTLRPYQMEGISWLAFLRSINLNGALCDEMGLGKTLQAIVSIALAHYDAKQQQKCHIKGNILASLVVCPSSLVGYWGNEISRILTHAIGTKCIQYNGPLKNRQMIWNSCCSIDDFVLVTSYNILRTDIILIEKLRWKYCILDEGHLLKNPKSATAKASRCLRSDYKLILTGTPVQNNVQELWAIFDFLMPNYLGSEAEFSSRFSRDITRGQLSGAATEDIQRGLYKLRQLHQQVLPFILRREKDQVLNELPPKTITHIPCEMSTLQRELYEYFANQKRTKDAIGAVDRILETSSADTANVTNIVTLQDADFSVLHSLRLLCTHPSLVDTSGLKNVRTADFSSIECSGKLLALNDLLRSSQIAPREVTGADNDESLLYVSDFYSSCIIENESAGKFSDDVNKEKLELSAYRPKCSRKCLIYSQFKQSLDVIEAQLFKHQMPSLNYLRIDGSVDPQKRTAIVQKFNDDDEVKCLLLTTKVGGLGLNLQAASMVIFIENDWNPHSDLQAMDRAHRMGQLQKVDIYILFCPNTIEDKILRVQEMKLKMSEAIVNTENSTMYSMGTDRILDLF